MQECIILINFSVYAKIEEKYQDLIDNGTTDSMLRDTESLTNEFNER